MEANPQKAVYYPIGQQSFEQLRKNGCLYIDKTRFVEKLVFRGNQYFFLGRPRRFGKSLFLSTLKCFFEGKRELFKSLYVDSMRWDWEEWPVLLFDLNVESYNDLASLNSILGNQLAQYEKQYGVEPTDSNLSVRFFNLVRAAQKKMEKNVVILIDEYDKPLVCNLHNKEKFELMRDHLMAFYSNFKSSADFIKMVFLTGVSRFAHLSLFSGNNIDDISFDDEFADICGITEHELLDNFQQGISDLAKRRQWGHEQVLTELKRRYDGYHFAEVCPDIYNPYSLLNALNKRKLGDYWLSSGGLTRLVVKQIKKFNYDLKSLIDARCTQSEIEGLDFDSPRPKALLYQTGYLTIKSYDSERDVITLGLPNDEVKRGFLEFLLPYYLDNKPIDDLRFLVLSMVEEVKEGRAEEFVKRLKSLFANVPYDVKMESENNLQVAIFILTMLLGMEVDAERRTSDGRIDIFIRTPKYYYIIELKIDATAQAALDQINKKQYDLPFACDNREIIKIGINFSTTHRRITEWLIERQ